MKKLIVLIAAFVTVLALAVPVVAHTSSSKYPTHANTSSVHKNSYDLWCDYSEGGRHITRFKYYNGGPSSVQMRQQIDPSGSSPVQSSYRIVGVGYTKTWTKTWYIGRDWSMWTGSYFPGWGSGDSHYATSSAQFCGYLY